MSIFKNENETAYVGGRKHFTDVIKNTGTANLLVWKQPEEDFNTNSTLIVMPGETAIFVKGGIIEQTFTNGTYKLSTSNYPFISRIKNAFSGGVSTFNCVVYFFREAESMEIQWGSDSPIPVRDKRFDIVTYVRARGAYRIRITDPESLLKKLLGSNVNLMEQKDLNNYFAETFSSIIKSFVSNYLNNYENELIGVLSRLEDISQNIKPSIDTELEGYGLTCIRFKLTALDFDQAKYDRIDDLQIDSKISQIKTAEGNAAVFEILKDNWGRQNAANFFNNLSQNPGAGGIGAAGAGVGAGIVAGSVVSEMAKQMFAPLTSYSTPQTEPSAPTQYSVSSRFRPQNKVEQKLESDDASNSDFTKTLQKLKEVFDAGYITQEEYEKKKAEILSRI